MKKKEIEKLGKEIEKKKSLSDEIKAKINEKIFVNFFVAILIMLYFATIVLVNIYFSHSIFIIVCRILNTACLITTIVLFEISFYKEKSTIAIFGIECMFIFIFTMFMPYILLETNGSTKLYTMMVGATCVLYYIAKSIIIYICEKKKHIKSLSDIKEIVKKESKKR